MQTCCKKGGKRQDHLDFQDSNNLRLLAGYGDSPLTSPAAVPVVLRLELMVLNTADDGLTVLRKTLVRHHHNKESFLFVCHLCWFGECGRHSMSIVVQGVGSHLRFYCCSETFHLHKPITASIDNCEDERCQHPDMLIHLRIWTPGFVVRGFFSQVIILERLLRPVKNILEQVA